MTLRLAVTADLHYDVLRSRAPATALARRVQEAGPGAILLIGDTATADGDLLEQCLGLFPPGVPRLFVPGNHELWHGFSRSEAEVKPWRFPVATTASPRCAREKPCHTGEAVARSLMELRRRVEACGWHWLPGSPWRAGDLAIVGSLGWYDYSFAEPRLGLPRRFYEQKLSPGAARLLGRHDLQPDAADVPEQARHFPARWNDGRFIAGIESDEAFLAARLAELESDLSSVAGASQVVAGVHMVPHQELLPRVPDGPVPVRKRKYAFARAYLGSGAIARVILRHANVSHIVCGHSHVPAEAVIDGRRWINIGSTYTGKRLVVLEVEP